MPDPYSSDDPDVTLACYALTEAVQFIQERMGIDDGDVAGHFFSGANEEAIINFFVAYIRYERAWRTDDA